MRSTDDPSMVDAETLLDSVQSGGEIGQLAKAEIMRRLKVCKRATECPSSPDGGHQVDTSMESGPNNCFLCEQPTPRRSTPSKDRNP